MCQGYWALILDATRARILRDPVLPGAAPPAELVLRSEQLSLLDAITRGRRERPSQFRERLLQDERAFVRQCVGLLDIHRRAGDFDRLAVFAGPRLLETVHEQMPGPLEALVVAERSTRLMHLGEAELRRVVDQTLGR